MGSSVLAPVQERGRVALEHLGLPNRREESWRLTDLKRLGAVAALPASTSPFPTPLPLCLEGVTRLVLNGFDDPLAGQALPEGISALNAEELEQALGHTLDRCGCAQVWPVEFNHAKAQQILALRVRGRV
ncbi:MAG: ABC transporter permease, partial [Cyanobacteriota bacterium]|nr:ABC transporter permease [Cyanobacteriota bacterium]